MCARMGTGAGVFATAPTKAIRRVIIFVGVFLPWSLKLTPSRMGGHSQARSGF